MPVYTIIFWNGKRFVGYIPIDGNMLCEDYITAWGSVGDTLNPNNLPDPVKAAKVLNTEVDDPLFTKLYGIDIDDYENFPYNFDKMRSEFLSKML